MLCGNFEAKIETSLFIRRMWDEPRVFVSLARSGQARGDMRSMDYDVHRAQLWNEETGMDSFPPGPRGPQLQHFREK